LGRIKDLTGKTFAKLTATEPTVKRSSQGSVIWKCKCICGNETFVAGNTLNAGQTLSCGCLRDEKLANIGKLKARNISGQKFGKLTAIKSTSKRDNGHIMWLCKCDCGKDDVYVSLTNLTTGNTLSCGCRNSEIAKGNAPKNISKFINNKYIANTRMDTINNNKAFKNSKTGIRGVIFEKGKYRATIQFQKKTYNLGRHFTKEEATKAREEAELKLHGNFLKWYNNEFKKNRKLKDD
jgi:hypothetical protein